MLSTCVDLHNVNEGKPRLMPNAHFQDLHLDVEFETRDLLRTSFRGWRNRVLIGLGICLLMAAAITYFLISIEMTDILFDLLAVWVGVPLIIIVGRSLQLVFECKKYVAALGEHGRSVHFQFGHVSDGFDVIKGKSFSHVAWEEVVKAEEQPHYFQLLRNKSEGCVLPKRCFQGESDVMQMRHILRENLGDKAKLMER